MRILNLMKADFLKMKHTAFYWIHIFLPIMGSLIFLGYYYNSKINPVVKVNSYLDALALVFPMIIGIVCSIAVEREAASGKFKEMLSCEYGKLACILSKIFVLLVLGFISLSLSIIIFFMGFKYVLGQNILPLSFYLKMIVIIFGAEMFCYLFHLWLCIKFGNGATIGMGMFESVLASLMVTGLGDGIWQWIPSAWAVTFCNNFFVKKADTVDVFNRLANINDVFSKSVIGARNCVIFTITFGMLFLIWFNFFEGRAEE